MIEMSVGVALAEVPVNVAPLVDDDDFITLKDAVVYNETGMDLRWNFVTADGAYTSTAVTPTTSGDYDWVHQGDGMYSIGIPASGGASINNNALGYGWFTGKATDVAPWVGPIIKFVPATIVQTTIATLASQTSFTLTAGSANDDAYNGWLAVVRDSVTSVQVALGVVSDYTGASKTVALQADPAIFTMAVGDYITLIPQPNGLSIQQKADVSAQADTAISDAFTFTTAGVVDANVERINNVAVIGAGTSGDKWRA